jgi:hypothetical protein
MVLTALYDSGGDPAAGTPPLKKGEVLTLVCKHDSGWLEVITSAGEQGYAHAHKHTPSFLNAGKKRALLFKAQLASSASLALLGVYARLHDNACGSTRVSTKLNVHVFPQTPYFRLTSVSNNLSEIRLSGEMWL